jgi:membrane-associated protease RseP (regulator of RpoE activity)
MRRIAIALASAVLALLVVAGTALAATSAQADAAKVWIGILPVNITSKLAERFSLGQTEGVIVAAVTPESPAAAAGVKVGDVLAAINGVAVKTAQDARAEIAKSKPGDEVALTIVRAGSSRTIKITAAAAPAKAQPLKQLIQRLQRKFENNYGSAHTYKDAGGQVVTANSIPGVVTAISATSITLTPNNPQSRGGPFTIDGSTRIVSGRRGATIDNIKTGDKVVVVVIADSTHAEAISKVSPASVLRQLPQLRQFRQQRQQPRAGARA